MRAICRTVLRGLCVVAVLPSVLLAVGLCAFWRWLWDDDDERSRYGYGSRVCVDNYEAYPGIFRVSFDSGDVRAAVVLTRPQLEQLRSCVTDSLAHDDAVRRRRGGDL